MANAEKEAEEYSTPEAIELLKEKYFSFWEGPKEDVDLRYEQFRSQNKLHTSDVNVYIGFN